MNEAKQKKIEKKRPKSKKIISIILPIILILAGIAGYRHFSSSPVEMKRKPPTKQAALVETITLTPGTHQGYVEVMGTVRPDREVLLKSRVTGEVVFVSPNFVQGGLIKKGETLIKLDESDYLIDLKKAASALEKALSDMSLEQGHQKIAKEEFKLLKDIQVSGGISKSDLALRKPQLAMSLALVESARADVERAKLNLSRTTITAPFNAMILEKQVSQGTLLTTQGPVALLVDVDTFEVEALVPPDQLSVIRIDEENGSKAWVRSQSSNSIRIGKVVRTTGQINGQGLMAGVIIHVPDPLGLETADNISRLLLNDYVDIKIAGQLFENTCKVPRALLREGNTVWVYNKEEQLEIRTITPVWKEKDYIFIRNGLNPGDQLITSELPAPVNGMALQLASGEQS
jgi:RND family efflux transporter MFP subunit